jgi:hypothetical protein
VSSSNGSQYLDQLKNQQLQYSGNLAQQQAIYQREAGNTQVQNQANQALDQNYMNAAQNPQGGMSGYGYGGPYSMPGVGLSAGAGLGGTGFNGGFYSGFGF